MVGSPFKLETHEPEETQRFGAALGGGIEGGEVIVLNGPLGAGKTLTVRGIVGGLAGDVGSVASPTYVLHRVYEGDIRVHHIDAYRLSGVADLYDLGLEEIPGADEILIIEWGERVAKGLPEMHLEVRIDHMEGDSRKIRVMAHGAPFKRVFENLNKELSSS